jgi:hypothetical protein
MIDLARHWPRELTHLLKDLQPRANDPACLVVDADLSEDEMRLLNLFEGSARHEHVTFEDPRTSRPYFAHLSTPIGLGSPADPKGHVGRVRIVLTGVEPH